MVWFVPQHTRVLVSSNYRSENLIIQSLSLLMHQGRVGQGIIMRTYFCQHSGYNTMVRDTERRLTLPTPTHAVCEGLFLSTLTLPHFSTLNTIYHFSQSHNPSRPSWRKLDKLPIFLFFANLMPSLLMFSGVSVREKLREMCSCLHSECCTSRQ